MENLKMRHELKHYINSFDYFALKSRLSSVARYDPHSGDDGRYRIRSLYFDNLYDKALMEKIDGVNNREKFRIRYYNDDTSFIKLEKKSKLNGLCSKRSCNITKDQCMKILNGDISWMLNSDNQLLMELYCKMHYQQLKPKIIVDYSREAFIYEPGNVRITIDSEIRTSLNSLEIFNQNLSTINTVEGALILEVKYDEFLPEIICDIVQTKDRHSTAFSKYAVCRIYG